MEPGCIALHDGHGTEDSGEDVTDRSANADRLAGARAGDAHQAAERLHDDVVSGSVGVAAGVAETRQRSVDQPRVPLAETLGGQVEFLHCSGAEIFNEHVGPIDEVQERLAIGVLLEIQGDALFSAVDAGEVRTLSILQERTKGSRVVAGSGTFDLDHFRAQVRQQ